MTSARPSSRWALGSGLSDVRKVRFSTVPTGARVAYASAGRGPALVVPAAWISHLELLWQDPAYRAFITPLTAARTVVQYDRPGCGLSEPWPGPQDLDSDLAVLQTVADELDLGPSPALGFEREVVVADVPSPLQLSECRSARLDVSEQADLPEPLT